MATIRNLTKSAQGFPLPGGPLTLKPGENKVTDAQLAQLEDASSRFGKAFSALVKARKLEVPQAAAAAARARERSAPKTLAELREDAEAALTALDEAEKAEAAKLAAAVVVPPAGEATGEKGGGKGRGGAQK